MSLSVERRYQKAMDAERKAFKMLHETAPDTAQYTQLWHAWQMSIAETDAARAELLKGLGRP